VVEFHRLAVVKQLGEKLTTGHKSGGGVNLSTIHHKEKMTGKMMIFKVQQFDTNHKFMGSNLAAIQHQ
jgi:hypothetical protein